MIRIAAFATSLVGALLLPLVALAGYDLTISASETDPDVNVTSSPVGLDSLFLWVKCADEGLSAVEVDVGGSIPVYSFSPRGDYVFNARSVPSLLLAIVGCPSGDSVDMLLGSFLVNDTAGGNLYLEPSENWDYLVVTSCDSTQYVYPYIPRAVGFASNGSEPDTTGYAWGCGTFPERADPQAPLGLSSWSTAYGAPPSGLGADGGVGVIRKISHLGLIVAGNFSQVGNLSVPGIARYRFDGGQVQGHWDWPWGTQPFAPSSGSYLAAHVSDAGDVAVGGNTPAPFQYYDGSSWTADPVLLFPMDPVVIYGIEHWSVNDKFLVVGKFENSGGGPLGCLAQWNPAIAIPPRFEPFGYPVVSETHWFDTVIGDIVLAVTEIDRPGQAFDGWVCIGGSWTWIIRNGQSISTPNVAIFDDEGGLHLSGLPGPVHDFELRPLPMHLPTQLYVAGEFGKVSPDKEDDPVWQMALNNEGVISWSPLPGGGGPFTFGATSWAVIHELLFQNGYLYAVGDFDFVLTEFPGGIVQSCDGFARYKMDSGVWESLSEASSINGATVAGERTPGAVVIGGSFTQVDGTIASYHVGQFNPFDIVAAPEVPSTSVAAPLAMQITSANPTRGPVSVNYVVPRNTFVLLGVYDVAGRQIVRLVEEMQNAGEQNHTWDGTTSPGRTLPPGVYFVRLEAGGERMASKVTVVR